jgi:hypothetical protein
LSSKYQYRPPSAFRPFWRRFTDERARDLQATIALYDEVRAQYHASPWCQEGALNSVVGRIVEDMSKYVTPSPAFADVLDRCLRDVLALETAIFTFPDTNWSTATLSLKEQVDLARQLRAQQHFLGNQDRAIDFIVRDLGNVYGGLIQALPELSGEDAAFTVPLITLLPDPRDTVDRLMGTLQKDDLVQCGLFTTIQRRLYENVCAASGVVPDTEHRKPLILAATSELPSLELAQTYLRGTPLLDLLLSPVPFALPDHVRFEHMHILAGSGHGKTQTLQHLIINDLGRDELPGMVIIDSQ